MGTALKIAEDIGAQPLDEQVEAAFEQHDAQLTEAEDLAHGKWNGWVKRIDDPYKQAVTAQALENQQAYIHSLPRQIIQETTLMGDPGIAVNPDLAFPLIRAIMPNLAATELFATQPMNSPYGLIFYLQFVYGSNKGATKRGTLLFDYPDKTYSSETVKNEPVTTLSGSAGPFTHVFAWKPVRPGTVTLSGPATGGGSTRTITDDGNGNLGGGTIDYANGTASGVSFGGNVTGDVVATYTQNSEGSDYIPQVDLLLTSLPVTAETHKLRTRVSSEANINLKRVHGLDAVQELGNVSGELIKYDIFRNDQYRSAGMRMSKAA